MRGRKSLALRGFAMILLAVGIMSTGVYSAAAQAPACVEEPALAFFDSNEDGVLSIEELQAVADAFPDDAELQGLVDQAAADENFGGIQYENCNGDADPDPTPPANGDDDDDNGVDDGDDNGVDDGDDNGVDELPDTGDGTAADQGTTAILMAGAASALALVGAFALRMRRA